jgi:iron complex transport system substrate-binding protein
MKGARVIDRYESHRCPRAAWMMRQAGALFLACCFAIAAIGPVNGQVTRTVTDLAGRTVNVPASPRKIACFFGPSYEKVFLFGLGDRVAAMSISQTPWAHKFNPSLKNVTVMPSYSDPDVERMLQMGIDLVFYWQFPQQIQRMASAGIPVVCPSWPTIQPPTNAEEFMRRHKEEIRFYGKVLGDKAKKIADVYCAYYDDRMKRVLSVTSRIPDSQRPSVYYITGQNAFATQGKYSLAYWLTHVAGGTLVSNELAPGFVDVTMEQVVAWNPEVIIIGMRVPRETIMADPRWSTLCAVKSKRVYESPEGGFLWGHGSSEVPLFVEWLAKILHPDKFGHLDVEKDTREYYRKFYRYDLSGNEAQRILRHLPPSS